MTEYGKNILSPDIRKTSEIKYHYDNAPGDRYVFLDKKKCPESSIYTIVRVVKDIDSDQDAYIDPHTHSCDSEFLFIGDNADMTGLKARVRLGDEDFIVESPAAVFVPKDLEHTLQLIEGSGKFINIVVNPEYNKSLK